MNFHIIDNENLILHKANSPPFYLERFPIRKVQQLSREVELERRGSTDSGIGLTESQLIIGEKYRSEQVTELSTHDSVHHIHDVRKQVAISKDIFPEEDVDYSFRNGNIECFFENKDVNYRFEGGSIEDFFEDIDLIYFHEERIVEIYPEDRDISKTPTSIMGIIKKAFYHTIKMIVEPYKLSLYVYMAFISIVLGIIHYLREMLYTCPLAIHASLQSST